MREKRPLGDRIVEKIDNAVYNSFHLVYWPTLAVTAGVFGALAGDGVAHIINGANDVINIIPGFPVNKETVVGAAAAEVITFGGIAAHQIRKAVRRQR